MYWACASLLLHLWKAGQGTGLSVSGLQFRSVEKLPCCLQPEEVKSVTISVPCKESLHRFVPSGQTSPRYNTGFLWWLLIWVFMRFNSSVLCPWTNLFSSDALALRLLCDLTIAEMLAHRLYFSICWLLTFLHGFESPTSFCVPWWTCLLTILYWTGSWSHCLPRLLRAEFSDETIA